MGFDKELMKKARKIYQSILTLYSCCGEIICADETKSRLNKELKEELPAIKTLYMEHDDSTVLIIYETLRLSQTKKKK